MKTLVLSVVLSAVLAVNANGQIVPSSQTVDFGFLARKASAQQTITFKNAGAYPITMGSPELTNNAGNVFTIVDSGCAGGALLPGGSCSVTVSYSDSLPSLDSAQLIMPIATSGYNNVSVQLYGRAATVYDIAADTIAPITVYQGYSSWFILKDGAISGSPSFSFYIQANFPVHNISFNTQTGAFLYLPDTVVPQSFTILFVATKGTRSDSQIVTFSPIDQLPSEDTVFGIASQTNIPDSTSDEYTIYSDLLLPNDSVNFINNVDSAIHSITIIGKTLVFDGQDLRNLYGSYANGVPTYIHDINLIAEKIIIHKPLFFKETNVNITAQELTFQDSSDENPAYISTEPIDYETPISNVGTDSVAGEQGLKAGNITLKIQKFTSLNAESISVILNRFYLKGGTGQSVPIPNPYKDSPGIGGQGGVFSCNPLIGAIDSMNEYVLAPGGDGGKDASGVNSKQGTSGKINLSVGGYYDWVSPDWLEICMTQLRDAYIAECFNYVQSMSANYAGIVNQYIADSSEFGKITDPNVKDEVYQMKTEAEVAQQRLRLNLDYFGNPPGWVPMLSFEYNLAAYNQEIANDMPILAYTYWAQALHDSLKTRISDDQTLLTNLESEITDLQNRYDTVNVEIPNVRDSITAVIQAISDLQNQINALYQQLEAQATQQVENANKPKSESFLQKAASIAGTLCTVIPIGQPILGAVGIGLQTAANFNPSDPLASISGFTNLQNSWNKTDAGDLTQVNQGLSALQSISSFTGIGSLGNLKSKFDASPNDKALAGAISALPALESEIQDWSQQPTAPQSQVQAVFQQLCAASPELIQDSAQMMDLNNRKMNLTQELNKMLNDIETLTQDISTVVITTNVASDSLSGLNSVYDAKLGVHLKNMEQQVRNRILLYTYWLRKSYEYRMLAPCPITPDSGLIWLDDIRREVTAVSNVSSLPISDYEAEFYNDLYNLADSILTDYTTDNSHYHYQTTAGIPLSPAQVASLNAGDTILINITQLPVFQSLIQDGARNLRIINIEFDSLPIKLRYPSSSPVAATFTMNVSHSGESQLTSSSGQVYRFVNGSLNDQQPFLWQTQYDNYTHSISQIGLSSSDSLLLQVLLGPNNSLKTGYFTLPGLNANLRLWISSHPSDSLLLDTTSGKSVGFSVYYEYQNGSNSQLQVDIAANDLEPLVQFDQQDVNGRQDCYGSVIRAYNGGQVNISVPQNYGEWYFDHWVSEDGSTLPNPTSSTQLMQMSSDHAIQAVYLGGLDSIHIWDSLFSHPDTISNPHSHYTGLRSTNDTAKLFLTASYIDGRQIDRTNLTSFTLTQGSNVAQLSGSDSNILTLISNPALNTGGYIKVQAEYVENGVVLFDTISFAYGNSVSVGVKQSLPVSDQFGLWLYPNPANNTLNLNYSVSGEGAMNLSIFDMLGRNVQTLESGQSSGFNSLSTDLTNYNPGTYIVVLRNGKNFMMRKLLVLH